MERLMSTWNGYAKAIEAGGGFHATTVRELLTVAGKQAAGARIVEDIEQQLADVHVGHFPTSIPRDQNARVMLYNQDRPGLGVVLHLVRRLAEGDSQGTTEAIQILQLETLLRGYVKP
jgi:hypothetical protein